MNSNLKMTVARSKSRSNFLSPVFITKCLSKNFVLLRIQALLHSIEFSAPWPVWVVPG